MITHRWASKPENPNDTSNTAFYNVVELADDGVGVERIVHTHLPKPEARKLAGDHNTAIANAERKASTERVVAHATQPKQPLTTKAPERGSSGCAMDLAFILIAVIGIGFILPQFSREPYRHKDWPGFFVLALLILPFIFACRRSRWPALGGIVFSGLVASIYITLFSDHLPAMSAYPGAQYRDPGEGFVRAFYVIRFYPEEALICASSMGLLICFGVVLFRRGSSNTAIAEPPSTDSSLSGVLRCVQCSATIPVPSNSPRIVRCPQCGAQHMSPNERNA